VFEFGNFDYILGVAKKYNIRVFPIIGWQRPPSWIPADIGTEVADPGPRSMHPSNTTDPDTKKKHTKKWVSNNISMENESGLAQFKQLIKTIVTRYKNNPTIGAYILGNVSGIIYS
jgi:hypothetical protein